jgi:superfamily II DNA helicase RecQ
MADAGAVVRDFEVVAEQICDEFSVDKLHTHQHEALNNLVQGIDVFLSCKTGGGKSLCYQAFPCAWTLWNASPSPSDSERSEILMETDTQGPHNLPKVIIISPLLSIMKEQTTFLRSLGFTATYIGRDAAEDDDIVHGLFQFLFSSPEQLLDNPKWRDILRNDSYGSSVRLLVVDEAHTVLQWLV